MSRVLVAGVGNIFFGDDGFGSAVAQRLAADPPPGARVEDYGIRGLHLAYDLLAGYDAAVLIDAAPKGEMPGTLYVIEPEVAGPRDPAGATNGVHAAPDAHRMDLENVFATLRLLGGEPPPITLVACEPSTLDEGIGLSEPVERALDAALALVHRIVTEMALHRGPAPQGGAGARSARLPARWGAVKSGRGGAQHRFPGTVGKAVRSAKLPATWGAFKGEAMVRSLIWGGVGFAAAVGAERLFGSLGSDLRRYDSIRAMSGDPPFLVELGKMAGSMLLPFANSRKGEAVSELGTLQSDLMRYARIRSM